MTDTDSTHAFLSSGPVSPQTRKAARILLAALLGLIVSLLLGGSVDALFCWLGLASLIFGSTAFRHMPHLSKRWKAVLVLLYGLAGTAAWLMMSMAVLLRNIH
ncbi:hypothetical protein [Sphaerotilus uruguayifluvii]|uniref:Uncharacterized protein n=1 Tax=Sphaerotilus uruguayifluvii TaxID=2735897 RepID=A0ABX2G365_9BURK|nr:hypothetical protein [Leptothrix sp. C29]NRT56743.1 hypothetical protein [Leptothrix sp. C29]